MNSITWSDWITAINERMKAGGRKLVLVIDNAPSHKGDFEFKYLKVICLSPNATFCTQPMDTCVIISFKASCRRYFLEHLIESYDKNKDWKVVLDLVISWISRT